MEFGLRKLYSYIAAELVIIQTILALILVLEVLNQCNCFGLREQDLGKRAGLYEADGKKKQKGKDKRREFRSGMGNEESSYGDESYDSEDEYFDEGDDEKPKPVVKPPVIRKPPTPEPSSPEPSEEISEVESSSSSIPTPPPKKKTPPKKKEAPKKVAPKKEKTPEPIREPTPPPKKK
jgi:hypothetical protein